MHRVYTAAPFTWQAKILERAEQLRALGYVITADWLTQEGTFTNPDNTTIVKKPGLHADCQNISNRDIKNILESDTLILFDPGVALERVTRVAEFGIALGTGRQCIVIQPEDPKLKDVISSAFVKFAEVPPELQQYGLKPVKEFASWEDFIASVPPRRPDLCAICGKEPGIAPHGYCQVCFTTWYA